MYHWLSADFITKNTKTWLGSLIYKIPSSCNVVNVCSTYIGMNWKLRQIVNKSAGVKSYEVGHSHMPSPISNCG